MTTPRSTGTGRQHPTGDAGDGWVQIPADVEREDQLLAGLTARQLALLAIPTLALWAAFAASRTLVPLPILVAAAIPIAVAVLTVVLGRRDGLPLDRLLLAGLRQARRPRRLVPAPGGVPALPRWAPAGRRQPGRRRPAAPAPLRLPAQGLSPGGVIDLGPAGAALVCHASSVSFALRTPTEQQALIAGFARYLNSLSGAAQILIRSRPVDLSATVTGLHAAASGLPHPGLERAARAHADFVAGLAADRDLLTRQVLLVLTDPAGGEQAGSRLRRRAADAADGLSAAGITVTVLDGPAAARLLAAADPWAAPYPAGLAAPDDLIVGTPAAAGAAASSSTSSSETGEWA